MIKVLKQEFIFETCPTDMCHASTLLKVQNGDVLCAWFGGTKEGNDDVSIWYSRRTKECWAKPQMLAWGKEPHWNPVFFQTTPNKITLFYKVGRQISKWRTMILESFDNGFTWSAPKEMIEGDEGGRGPVRNKPIRLTNGTIIAPSSTENGIWTAFVDTSKDNGETWKKQNSIGIHCLTYAEGNRTVEEGKSNIPVSEQSFYGRGVIQPTLWEDKEKNVHMFLRSTEGKIYRSDSFDFGTTWTDAYETQLPNNNSGIDIVRMEDGNLILVYNPIGENWGERTPISLAISKDNGNHFQKIINLHEGEGEFAYPAIIAFHEDIFICYTYKRKNIAFWQIKIII